MRTRVGWLSVAAALALAGVGCAAAMRPPLPHAPKAPPARVTLALQNVPLSEAVTQLLARANLSVMILGTLPAEPRVNMQLEGADPVTALELLARIGHLVIQSSDSPGGGRVVAIGPAPEGRSREKGAGRMPALVPPPFPDALSRVAVDLEAKDMPLRDAIALLTCQIPALPDQFRIVIDPSVPPDTRVTAHLHKVPLTWVLAALLQETQLTYGVQEEPDMEAARRVLSKPRITGPPSEAEVARAIDEAPRKYTVSIVPRPELTVSMASAAGQK